MRLPCESHTNRITRARMVTRTRSRTHTPLGTNPLVIPGSRRLHCHQLLRDLQRLLPTTNEVGAR